MDIKTIVYYALPLGVLYLIVALYRRHVFLKEAKENKRCMDQLRPAREKFLAGIQQIRDDLKALRTVAADPFAAKVDLSDAIKQALLDYDAARTTEQQRLDKAIERILEEIRNGKDMSDLYVDYVLRGRDNKQLKALILIFKQTAPQVLDLIRDDIIDIIRANTIWEGRMIFRFFFREFNVIGHERLERIFEKEQFEKLKRIESHGWELLEGMEEEMIRYA
ncbi:hypothetical protein [Aquirhabdus parva]|uniref:Uncharacterized protein n=1 Tax=Aquirhabdus parva TaxID=2283318 RepID=A0A345P981_9GAMM|nr:hypothetical protein [Aquirhabdus parva]AXI03840.1 hypothetical protein HYN46_13950 [Aquirhabdus parva]